MNKVIVVGGGAAGMLATIIAAKNGCEVTLFEKNEKLGKKVYITGKGRCNVTNNCDPEELLHAERTSRIIDSDGGAASMEKRKREGYF